jgi:hypothetical protein
MWPWGAKVTNAASFFVQKCTSRWVSFPSFRLSVISVCSSESSLSQRKWHPPPEVETEQNFFEFPTWDGGQGRR